MPKKGKAALKKKNKQKAKPKPNPAPAVDPSESMSSAANPSTDNNNNNNIDNNDSGIMDRRYLMEKYDIRLGPKGYVPGPIGQPKSIHIEEFSMLDPGGGRELLTKTEIHIGEGNHYGLVGKNGFGKTTLLKLMHTYDIEGFPNHIRMILVNQEELVSEMTVLESVLKADEVRQQIIDEEERLTRIQAEIDEQDEKTQNEISELLNMIWDMQSDLNFDQSEKLAMQMLTGLGFNKEQMKQKTKDLSGGWQMRCKLAQALFVAPDLMLLDEPTNHLDFPTVLWLQDYLKNYEKTVVIVSHDRTFLNAVCTHTIHLSQKKLIYYKGSYDNMLKTAKNELIEQIREHDAKMKQIKEIKEWIQKYKDKGEKMAAQVQSKRKTLERLEDEAELLAPPMADKTLKFEFPDIGGLDDYICRMSNVSFKYPNMVNDLLQNITLQLDMDSRIAMIGANGVGKSTLVKLIMGQLDPTEGDCIRNRQAKIALFTQYHMDQLNLEQSAVEFICTRFADDEEMVKHKDKVGYARRRLGRFNLTGKQHTQQMKYLSGGQKSRVAFCVATWTQPHFLIMDEPTNHLDMETIDSLVNAISGFHGGVLVISHDQYFLQAAANQFWAVTPERIRLFDDFENSKKFALKSRLEQIGDIADNEDEEKTMDHNQAAYQKMKQAKKEEKDAKLMERLKGGSKNQKGGKKANKKKK